MRGWSLESSEIDQLEIPDAVIKFALGLARESALTLTADRQTILLSAAAEVERYIGQMIFRGVGGSARVSTSVVEVAAPFFELPTVGALPRTQGAVTIISVERWDDFSEAFVAAQYIRRPLGRIRVEEGGAFQVVASVLPLPTVPDAITNATAMTFCYRELFRPGGQSAGDLSDGSAPSVAGALLRSGAGEALRGYRVPAA